MITTLPEPTLVHSLLPSSPHRTGLSTDAPSENGVRPFGLTQTTEVPAGTLMDLTGLRYDPHQQVNVDLEARPVTDPGQVIRMGTSYDTRHDNQRFTDKD